MWEAGRAAVVPCAARGTLHVLDLNAAFSAEHDADIDSLHVHLPRAALDDLAADVGAAPLADLKAPSPW